MEVERFCASGGLLPAPLDLGLLSERPAGSPKVSGCEAGGSLRPRPVGGLMLAEAGGQIAEPRSLPGIAARRNRLTLPCSFTPSFSPKGAVDATPEKFPRKPRGLSLRTPSSCASASYRFERTPSTPDPCRDDLKMITGGVAAVLFDFDGTLTSQPGERAHRREKRTDLVERAALLAPALQTLRDAGVTLGIISKSSESTITCALEEAELSHFFDGPIVAKAVGLEGKAGFIEDLVCAGALRHLGQSGLRQVLLVDDDVRELDRARALGIQTFAAPCSGGLQEEDLHEIVVNVLPEHAYLKADVSPVSTSARAAENSAVRDRFIMVSA